MYLFPFKEQWFLILIEFDSFADGAYDVISKKSSPNPSQQKSFFFYF